ncbi:hypothetical protein PV05_07402 [Exophiala xenobiotica]|uniref:Uncharacterized protein n=1 Tax=Exophiala xenobiotica TaxID=348802 RepID=A0A0D2F5F4_9EURO|nr:uncharacterized protein PV05_07402 [Exophiala xenobiotica]KIW55094.1 hypothetical protein PV05_07402 [Exophiala xenobiotica]
MHSSSSSSTATAPYPRPTSMNASEFASVPVRLSISPSISSGSSSASDSDSADHPTSPRSGSRRTRMERPRLGDRQRSNTIIVPKGRDVVQREKPQYPPTDARAMSPRRNSHDIERLERDVRQSLKEQARNLQSSLAALAEKIDEVKNDHDKLENENRFLQDYIGGLTRTMSKDNLGRSASTRKGKR